MGISQANLKPGGVRVATLIQHLQGSAKWAYVTQADKRQSDGPYFGFRSRVNTIAGFGKDWSKGIKKPALSVSLQSLCLPVEELTLAA